MKVMFHRRRWGDTQPLGYYDVHAVPRQRELVRLSDGVSDFSGLVWQVEHKVRPPQPAEIHVTIVADEPDQSSPPREGGSK